MTVFGKPFGAYFRFQAPFLMILAAVAVLRLVLSLAGLPNSTVKWVSVTVVGLLGLLFYAVRVHTSGFGSYKQLLAVLWVQGLVAQAIIIPAILLAAVTGKVNIYAAPEYNGAPNVPLHVVGHVVFGLVLGPLVGWLIGSIVMFVTKKVARGPATAAAAA